MSGHNSDEEGNRKLPPNDSSEDEGNRKLPPNDSSEDEGEVSSASRSLLSLALSSPLDSTDSTRDSTVSNAGTDMTPCCTTASASPVNASAQSGTTDESRIESHGFTPLDEKTLFEAFAARGHDANTGVPIGPRLDPEGALDLESQPSGSGVSTGDRAVFAKPDLKPAPSAKKADEYSNVPEKKIAKTKALPIVSKVPREGREIQGQIAKPEVQPISASKQGQSSVKQSKEGTDDSCISLSERSGDAETDCTDADVSNMSAMSLENRRKVFRGKKSQPKAQPKLADIVKEFFPSNPLVTYGDPDSRADTLDDAETLRLDSVSVRSSIPERGASVLFPDEVNYPDIPDRSRRAISLPAGNPKKAAKVPHDDRRAISEAPDDSRVESELPSLSVSLDDIPLPSPLASSSSSSSSRRVSDIDLAACKKLGKDEQPDREAGREVEAKDLGSQDVGDSDLSAVESIEKSSEASSDQDEKRPDPFRVPPARRVAVLSDSSLTQSSDVAQLQALQGWLNQGKDKGETPRVPNIPPSKEKRRVVLSDSSLTQSCDEAQLQALKGWVNQGRDKGEKKDGPPRVPNIPPETEKRKVVLSDSSSTRSSEEAQFQALKGWVTQGRDQGQQHLSTENREVPLPEGSVQDSDKFIASGGHVGDETSRGKQIETSMAEESREVAETGVQTEPQSAKPGDSKTPKRKRPDQKELSRQTSSEQESTDSSDQPSNVDVSPEEGLASKKYCSEFSRPVVLARRLSRSHSTGSVKEEHRHRRNFREWQESTKESPEREKREEEGSSTSKKPKEEESSTSKKPKEDEDKDEA